MPHVQTALSLETSGPAPASRVPVLLRRVLALPLAQAFTRFLGVGVVGLAVDASAFSVLDAGHVAPEWSRAASLLLATLVTWRLNRRHTFAPSGRQPFAEALRYGTVTLVAQGFSYGVFLSLVYGWPAAPRLLSLLIGAGLASVVGFAGHKLFAFRPVSDGSRAASPSIPSTGPRAPS